MDFGMLVTTDPWRHCIFSSKIKTGWKWGKHPYAISEIFLNIRTKPTSLKLREKAMLMSSIFSVGMDSMWMRWTTRYIIFSVSNGQEKTALMCAAGENRHRDVSLLLRKGADPLLRDKTVRSWLCSLKSRIEQRWTMRRTIVPMRV